MDEVALIKAAQAGDAGAFERLLHDRYDSIYRFAMSWCGNYHDAEDIAQQACIKLARNLAQFRFEAAFSTWLYRLVVNCAKDWQRSQARHQGEDHTHEDLDCVSDSPGSKQVEALVYLQQLLSTIKTLGEGFKETVILVFGEGMSHAEAAAVLDVQESTISWRIHSVRKKLSLLGESYATDEGGNQ